MFSLFDLYLLSSCAFTLLCWFLIVWFDKDTTKVYSNTKVAKRRVK